MSNGNLADLIRRYQLAAAGYAQAINMGNTVDSNKCFDEVESTFRELKQQGKPGLEAVSKLLESDNDGVKLWAAAHLLNYPEFNSLPILERLRESSTILAMTAEVTLDQWRNGQIKY